MTATIEDTGQNAIPVEVLETFAVELRFGKTIEAQVPVLVLDPSAPWQENLQKIQGQSQVAIHFPKAVDGRGLSLAARIREASADVQLHAVGGLHADMIYFLRRCGVDICHLPESARVLFDPVSATIESGLLKPFSQHYQRSADSVAGKLGSAAHRGESITLGAT